MILDTSFLVDVLRGRPEAADRERDLDATGGASVTAISVMELWEGIHLATQRESERARVRELLTGLHHVDFDRDSAMRAGSISARLVSAGTPIDLEDVMIAAIAIEHSMPVLTADPGHFERIDDVVVETY